MEGVKQLLETYAILRDSAFEPWGNQNERDCYAKIPTGRGGGSARQVGPKDGRAHRLLRDLERECAFLSDRYLKLLEGEHGKDC